MKNSQIKDGNEEKDEGNQLGLVVCYLRKLFEAKYCVVVEFLVERVRVTSWERRRGEMAAGRRKEK